MVITVLEWAGRLEYSHMGNPHFRIEFVSIWGLTYKQNGHWRRWRGGDEVTATIVSAWFKSPKPGYNFV
jgi:hypothetical protein